MEIQPLAIHKLFFFFTECLLCAGEMEDWLFIHFSKKKFIAQLLRSRGDKHLSFICSFSQYIFVYIFIVIVYIFIIYANDR